jgi:uncharacterized protein with NRDE domain
MCLLAFNWNNHPEYKLILVANRDEFFERPSEPLQEWESGFYGGKDLQAGGTWLGMHPNGRFAAITNFRDLKTKKEFSKSRGDLVKHYLEGEEEPLAYLQEIEKEKSEYDGFNLLVGNQESLYYLSNKMNGIKELVKGVFGLSNAVLETPWPKLLKAKNSLVHHIETGNFEPEKLMKGQHSRDTDPQNILPDTGATPEQEKLLSAQFINVGDYYGTVNSTVLLWKHNGEVEMMERKFDQVAKTFQDTRVRFRIAQLVEQNYY